MLHDMPKLVAIVAATGLPQSSGAARIEVNELKGPRNGRYKIGMKVFAGRKELPRNQAKTAV